MFYASFSDDDDIDEGRGEQGEETPTGTSQDQPIKSQRGPARAGRTLRGPSPSMFLKSARMTICKRRQSPRRNDSVLTMIKPAWGTMLGRRNGQRNLELACQLSEYLLDLWPDFSLPVDNRRALETLLAACLSTPPGAGPSGPLSASLRSRDTGRFLPLGSKLPPGEESRVQLGDTCPCPSPQHPHLRAAPPSAPVQVSPAVRKP